MLSVLLINKNKIKTHAWRLVSSMSLTEEKKDSCLQVYEYKVLNILNIKNKR
jgi:hypothetical protein